MTYRGSSQRTLSDLERTPLYDPKGPLRPSDAFLDLNRALSDIQGPPGSIELAHLSPKRTQGEPKAGWFLSRCHIGFWGGQKICRSPVIDLWLGIMEFWSGEDSSRSDSTTANTAHRPPPTATDTDTDTATDTARDTSPAPILLFAERPVQFEARTGPKRWHATSSALLCTPVFAGTLRAAGPIRWRWRWRWRLAMAGGDGGGSGGGGGDGGGDVEYGGEALTLEEIRSA